MASPDAAKPARGPAPGQGQVHHGEEFVPKLNKFIGQTASKAEVCLCVCLGITICRGLARATLALTSCLPLPCSQPAIPRWPPC